MLVLSRRVGENIIIGDCISVRIMEVRGNKVRLGIVAPPDIIVDRQEVHDRRCADGDIEFVADWAASAK